MRPAARIGLRRLDDAGMLRPMPKAKGQPHVKLGSTLKFANGRPQGGEEVLVIKADPGFPDLNPDIRKSCENRRLRSLVYGQCGRPLVQLTNFLHGRILNFLHAISADYTRNQACVGVHARLGFEERLEIRTIVYLYGKAAFTIAREPEDDLVNLRFGAPFFLGLLDVHRVNAGKSHGYALGFFIAVSSRPAMRLFFEYSL